MDHCWIYVRLYRLTYDKIEVVLDASKAPPPALVKGLGDRIA